MPKKHKDDRHEEAVRDELEILAESAGRYVRKMMDETQHMGQHADAFASAIRAEPVKAALIALGIGAVIGALLRR